MLHNLKSQIKQAFVPKSKLVVLNYHQLGERFDPKIHNEHIWNSVALFEEHMSYLQNNYRIVTLTEGLEALKSKSLKETLVCITFDDGDASITSLAMPILERLQIPATFFINTAYGKEKLGYWYNLGPYFEDKNLITAAETIRNTTNSNEYHNLIKLEDAYAIENLGTPSPFYADYMELAQCTHPLFHFGL